MMVDQLLVWYTSPAIDLEERLAKHKSADNMQSELSTDDTATQSPYSMHPSEVPSTPRRVLNDPRVMGEQMRVAACHQAEGQRVRTVRLTTQVHPEILVPYIYGDRGGRSINSIVNTTNCTIDYCALSPDEPERSPQSCGYVMNFLVSAGSSEALEEATIELKRLVERVQIHLQKKARGSSRSTRDKLMDERKEALEIEEEDVRRHYDVPQQAERGRIADERWVNGTGMDTENASWDMPSMQRMYFAPGEAQVPRERPRCRRVSDVEIDEKNDFVATQGSGRRTVVDTARDGAYRQQRGRMPNRFAASRRTRRYPEYTRWTHGYYPSQMRGEAGYAMCAVASPQQDNEQPRRIASNRQLHHIYQGIPRRFAQAGYNPCDYNEPRNENDVDYFAYDETADVANEIDGPCEAQGFVNRHNWPHPRQSLKRPLSKLRRDGPPPPPPPPNGYRHWTPYMYDYMYDEEDDGWMTEDEEADVGYGYPPQFHPVEMPVLHQRRRLGSTSSQTWSTSAGRGPQLMYKRRRIPQDGLPLRDDMTEDATFETHHREHILSSRDSRTSPVEQLDKGARCADSDAFPDRTGNFAGIRAEDGLMPSSPSVAHADIVDPDYGQDDTFMNEDIVVEHAAEALGDSNAMEKADVPANEALSGQQDVCADEEMPLFTSNSITGDEQPIGQTLQSEAVPLDSNVSTQETTGFESPQSSLTPANSPIREAPTSSSPSPSAAASSLGKNDGNEVVSSTPGVLFDVEAPVQVPDAVSKSTEQKDCSLNEAKPKQSNVENIVTDTIQMNGHAIASLEQLNEVEADFMIAKTSLSAQEDKLRRVEQNRKSRQRMKVLCGIVYELQCRLGSQSCSLEPSCRKELLDKLDSYLESVLTPNEQTLHEKVDALRAGLEHVLAVSRPSDDNSVVENTTESLELNVVLNSNAVSLVDAGTHHDECNGSNSTTWEDVEWFEEEASSDLTSESDELDFVAKISSERSNLKFEGDFLAIKRKEGASPRWPRELPPFVLSLLARVISSGPQSYVMRATLKRLLDEVVKGDPYNYLHPTNVSTDAKMSSPSPSCEFGCRGASALRWERKLVARISSRMKSFDNMAYSLARSTDGKEVLNRKKMNSIIRKLHLVAIQLHSLVSHLYCVKGQASCREIDSLRVALNNSHFERKMGVYKSKLKLVVPHKYQQSTQQLSSYDLAEELVRDTYEFFPELLLCVDIWGYNYRESLTKRHDSKRLSSRKRGGSMTTSDGQLFPLQYFREVESLAFDFEHDSNGLLRCICDELLNIVCLWNDFKWTDNFEAVEVDRVVSFESDVTASILKILELYAHHLQALWSIRLLDEPDQLRIVHFTEFNAYYSDRSQGSLNTITFSQTRGPGAPENPRDSLNYDWKSADRLVAAEIVKQRLAEEYWNRKVTALSALNPGSDEMQVTIDSKPSQLLSVDSICSWDQPTLLSYLLRWSDVYTIRTEVKTLSAVTDHMMKHDVQKLSFVGCGDTSAANDSVANKAVIDSSTRQLVAAVSRAQMLLRDALIGSEKLALHSASSQLPHEKKQLEMELQGDKAGQAATSNVEVAPSCQASTSTNDAEAHSNDATELCGEPIALNGADTCDVVEDVDMTVEQPELEDLIQLLAVTTQDMQKLRGHRPRSARMREKAQAQTLQLARQTVEIFRNIRNMYASQRR